MHHAFMLRPPETYFGVFGVKPSHCPMAGPRPCLARLSKASISCTFRRRVDPLFPYHPQFYHPHNSSPPLCLILSLFPRPQTSNLFSTMPWKPTNDAQVTTFSPTHSPTGSKPASRRTAFSQCFKNNSRTSISLSAGMKAGRGG